MDPFCGSGTTGIAASLLERKFLGLDINETYLKIGTQRREEITRGSARQLMYKRIKDCSYVDLPLELISEEPEIEKYGMPF